VNDQACGNECDASSELKCGEGGVYDPVEEVFYNCVTNNVSMCL
jgi:hypothetical protein